MTTIRINKNAYNYLIKVVNSNYYYINCMVLAQDKSLVDKDPIHEVCRLAKAASS